MVVAREACQWTDPPGRSVGCDCCTPVVFAIAFGDDEVVFALVVGGGRSKGRKSPHKRLIHPGSWIRIPPLSADSICTGRQNVSIGKEGQAILIAHFLDFSAVVGMPGGLDMSVIAKYVVKDMVESVIEPDEQMSRPRAAMSKNHPPDGAFFPAVGTYIADELVAMNLQRPIRI